MSQELKRVTPRVKMDDILLDISWREIAHRYFGKSASWLYHKIDERDVNGNGRPYRFSEEELLTLKGALCDLSDRIRKVADNL